MSNPIDKLAAALVAFQSEMPSVPKDATNPHFRNRYATLQALTESARPLLSKHGLGVVQTFNANIEGVEIVTTLLHTSGQSIGGTLFLRPSKADPQGFGSAITYGRRYAYAAILGLVTDEDDDGNAASAPAQTPKTTQAPKTATRTEIGMDAVGDWAERIAGAEGEISALVNKLAGKYAMSKEVETAIFAQAHEMRMDATKRGAA